MFLDQATRAIESVTRTKIGIPDRDDACIVGRNVDRTTELSRTSAISTKSPYDDPAPIDKQYLNRVAVQNRDHAIRSPYSTDDPMQEFVRHHSADHEARLRTNGPRMLCHRRAIVYDPHSAGICHIVGTGRSSSRINGTTTCPCHDHDHGNSQ